MDLDYNCREFEVRDAMAIIAASARRKTFLGANAGGKEESEAIDDRFHRGHGVWTDEEGGGEGR